MNILQKVATFIGLSLAISVLMIPATGLAHMGVDEGVEDLMVQMMMGEDLSQAEAQEMIEYMHGEENGWFGMMPISGMMGWGGSYGMGGFGWSFVWWLGLALMFVWLVVGLLAVAHLLKRFNN